MIVFVFFFQMIGSSWIFCGDFKLWQCWWTHGWSVQDGHLGHPFDARCPKCYPLGFPKWDNCDGHKFGHRSMSIKHSPPSNHTLGRIIYSYTRSTHGVVHEAHVTIDTPFENPGPLHGWACRPLHQSQILGGSMLTMALDLHMQKIYLLDWGRIKCP